jgi:hypothetical protein
MFELVPQIGQKCLWVVPQKICTFILLDPVNFIKILETIT